MKKKRMKRSAAAGKAEPITPEQAAAREAAAREAAARAEAEKEAAAREAAAKEEAVRQAVAARQAAALAEPIAPGKWLQYIALAALVFAAAVTAQIGSYMSQKTGGLIAAVVIIAVLFLAGGERARRLLTPVSFAVMGYMLLAGLSTLYARSGKFAIAEFSEMLIAFAVFVCIVLYAKESAVSFRRVAGVLAAAAAPVGILSIDAASCNILVRPFRAIANLLNSGYGDTTGGFFYSRLHTIFGNPNLYAGFLSIACLLSLWLLLTAQTRRQRILCGVLLTVNTVSYLLAFSMGSLGVFFAAVLLMLALCPKGSRIGFFLLLFQTAVVALGTAAVSVRGFGDTVTGSPVPMLALIAGCGVFYLLEVFVRQRITQALVGKDKVLIGIVAALVIAVVVFLVLSLQLTGPFTFGQESDMRRTADLPAGEYTLTVQSSAPVNIRVSYKNTANLIQNNDTELATGNSDAPIRFTVPEDSRLVFVTFWGESGVVLTDASYTGASEGSLNLGYKMLPEFVADRIQDLSANGNVVQRGVYRQDALRLFKTAPIFGRGLGGFENGVVSVQDYYYETSHAHNHYVEVLCDLGVLGLLAYLSILGTAVWCLLKSRKAKPMMVAILAACVFQMFGQAVSDLTWSVGGCMVLFFAVLAMIALYCGDVLRLSVPHKSKGYAVRVPVAVFAAAFVVMIGLNLYAYFISHRSDATLDTLKKCASIDLFEENDYKLSYLINALVNGGNDPTTASKFASELQKEESNSITIPLAQYYCSAGAYDDAMDTIEQGSNYMRADEKVWRQVFDVYETMIDPVAQVFAIPLLEEKDRYIGRMKETYDKLCEVNAHQLDNVELTTANNAFLGKLLAIDALPEYDMTAVLDLFSTMVLDTKYAPDINVDGVPDYATVPQGTVTWHGDGSFTAEQDSVIELRTAIRKEGNYAVVAEAADLSGITGAEINGVPTVYDSASGCTEPLEHWSETEPVIKLYVRAGTTIDRIQYLC